MEQATLRYSDNELKEFEELLNKKLTASKKEIDDLKSSILRGQSGYDDNHEGSKTLEDGAASFQKEHLNQLAARTQKYISQLENALARIKTGTYGVCIDTGKLINKARLRIVPHTQHSIEAKNNRI